MFSRKVKWIKIANSNQELDNLVPINELRVLNKEGYSLCLGRNSKGFYAMKDKCPHQGYSFKGGACTENDKMVCPIHRYGFDVHTGRGGGDAAIVYNIEYREDGVFVGVSYFSIF